MIRSFKFCLVGAVAALSLNAGVIQIGSGTSGVNGLTASYITSATSSSCAGAALAQAGFTNCATGAGFGGAGDKNYNAVLFDGVAPTPAPAVAGTNTSTASVSTSLDGSVTFAMIDDNASGASNHNFWATNAAAATITIPVGIFGVDKVWTMLNDYWGTNTGASTEVDFYFNASSSDGSTGTTIQDKITLVNGVDIRSSIDCTNVTGAACPVQTTGATAGQTNGSIQSTLTAGGGVTSGDATVYSGNVYSTGYTSVSSAGTLFTGTTGNLALDAQAFDFATTYNSYWLTKIVVNNVSNNLNFSRDALSAVSVETTATPEPSTLILLGTGLGIAGFLKRKRTS